MKEMIYKDELIDWGEVLDEGTYKGLDYAIVSKGKFPCAYIGCPYGVSGIDDEILKKIKVHGKFTFYGKGYWDLISTFGRRFLGWDYGHMDLGDFTYWAEKYEKDCPPKETLKKWTTQEILDEVKDVIDQLIDLLTAGV